jgi:hypothetical protein
MAPRWPSTRATTFSEESMITMVPGLSEKASSTMDLTA